ncbi:MAG: hypothetical protein P4L43_03115 [Syntrophobacteraceae bacterium]|nr:hypothetical protein [Syntrophobacteraceae bacterium]
MRSVKFLLLIWMCFSVTVAGADILPFPGVRRPRPPLERNYEQHGNSGVENPAGPRLVGVSMAAAKVAVRIKKTRGGAEGATEATPFVADVTADFDMLGGSALKSGKGIDVLFPVDVDKGGAPAGGSFAVTVDGKPGADLKKRSWTVTGDHGKPLGLWGYAWRLPPVKPGQKLRVAVRYSVFLPQIAGKAQFIYFLRSGALWDGPIGRETVNVTTQKGLRVKVLSPVALKPVSSTDSLTWEIINVKPAEDIRLEIFPRDKP